jgi:hypothetical protein
MRGIWGNGRSPHRLGSAAGPALTAGLADALAARGGAASTGSGVSSGVTTGSVNAFAGAGKSGLAGIGTQPDRTSAAAPLAVVIASLRGTMRKFSGSVRLLWPRHQAIGAVSVAADRGAGPRAPAAIPRMLRRSVAAAALGAVVVITQACGASAAGAAATASSQPPASSSAGASLSRPVTYTAHVFMPGMKVTVPTSGWTIYEDHPGEFNLASPPGRLAGTSIHFWLDPYVSTPDDRPIRTVGRTPTALIGWLRSNPDFVVSAPVRQRIAHGIRAASVDLDVSAAAPRSDPGCPGPCLDYFVWPRFGFVYGTGRGEPIRLFFATLGTNVKSHTFVISIDTPNADAFSAVVPIAEKIIDSVRLPATISAG